MKLQRLKELALDAIEQCDLAKNKDAHIGNVLAAQIVIGDFNRYACPANILPFLESYEELLAALEKIAAYPSKRSDELGYAGCRDVARQAITNAEKLNHE